MKFNKILSYMAFGVGMVACLASCTDDRVSNPTLIEPEAGSFVLFQPEYSGSVVDLNNQDNPDYGIVLTWNQPTYTSNGAPIGFNAGAGTSYKVMISPSGLFTNAYDHALLQKDGTYTGEAFDYVVVDEVYQTTTTNVLAKTINLALNRWNQHNPATEAVWTEGQNLEPMEITVKVLSRVVDGGENLLFSIESNPITLQVKPYYQKTQEESIPEPIYMPGNGNGWNHDFAPILTYNADLNALSGYAYMNGEFKFTVADNWGDGEYNCSHFNQDLCSSNIVISEGTGNIGFSGDPGMYVVSVDLKNGSIVAEPSTWRLVGDFNGWAPDDDTQIMTYDMEKHCLVKTGATVTENGWKFTSNGNWDVNYGGDLKALERNGANIEIAGSTICLFLENTKTTQGVVYATVE